MSPCRNVPIANAPAPSGIGGRPLRSTLDGLSIAPIPFHGSDALEPDIGQKRLPPETPAPDDALGTMQPEASGRSITSREPPSATSAVDRNDRDVLPAVLDFVKKQPVGLEAGEVSALRTGRDKRRARRDARLLAFDRVEHRRDLRVVSSGQVDLLPAVTLQPRKQVGVWSRDDDQILLFKPGRQPLLRTRRGNPEFGGGDCPRLGDSRFLAIRFPMISEPEKPPAPHHGRSGKRHCAFGMRTYRLTSLIFCSSGFPTSLRTYTVDLRALPSVDGPAQSRDRRDAARSPGSPRH